MKKYIMFIATILFSCKIESSFHKLSASIPLGIAYDWIAYKSIDSLRNICQTAGGYLRSVESILPGHQSFNEYMRSSAIPSEESDSIKEVLQNITAIAIYLPIKMPIIDESPTAVTCARIALYSLASKLINYLPSKTPERGIAHTTLKHLATASRIAKKGYFTYFNGSWIFKLTLPTILNNQELIESALEENAF